MNTALTDFRARRTPIPTPVAVRLAGSALVGLSLAILTATELIALPVAVLIAVISAAAAVACTLIHPYRRRLRDYAQRHNVTMAPNIGQIFPLMIWWLAAMLLVLLSLPLWGSLLVGLVGFALAFLLYPHVDGSRKLAYAEALE
ncbi:hypothetical protein C3B44_02275 [Corynebacterium yudongzhengii]|uniref:Uncharacterized protein n=1 Tax=Corynebacterium yudongzhengii TaxID=2080740 RepID=A0A2U1T6Z5_9CORY|nr:hypothetical protein [Corynebacterium yudongzhengii]AWB81319.1 hypothetical protein C3B44_02275 [Corynebacterium yudongzhengii]PWC01762.1 hypothetical protein DF222_05360 [Corynebacterium yudongzhengii]